uniref:Ras-related protein RABF2a-like n=1 Tax=Rhizophora mucronata TaxID=61149 RepID=A0A2P2JU20_RHIMU
MNLNTKLVFPVPISPKSTSLACMNLLPGLAIAKLWSISRNQSQNSWTKEKE